MGHTNDGKKQLREEKRLVKRAGNKHRRLEGKRSLLDGPETAHEVEPDLGRHRSAPLNGIDQKPTPDDDPPA